MESLITLVVIIIVFNLISSLLRSLRGGQPAPRKTVQVRSERSSVEELAEQWVDHTSYSYLAVPEDGRVEPDHDQETDKIDIEIEDIREIEEGRFKQLQQKKTCRSSSIASCLNQTLTKKDPLVSAFIFHEIFEQPPAIRRKR